MQDKKEDTRAELRQQLLASVSQNFGEVRAVKASDQIAFTADCIDRVRRLDLKLAAAFESKSRP